MTNKTVATPKKIITAKK